MHFSKKRKGTRDLDFPVISLRKTDIALNRYRGSAAITVWFLD
jgi:hypothetical protein